MEDNSYEIFKDIPEYIGIYKVSNKGNIISLSRNVWSVKNNSFSVLKERILKPLITRHGYYRVALFKDNKYRYIFIHRIVAQAFIPNPENKPQINHINGIKTDNCLENLEWNTPRENRKHAFEIGLSKPRRGEDSNMCKINKETVYNIRNSNLSQHDLAIKYNIKQSTVSHIKSRKPWKHI